MMKNLIFLVFTLVLVLLPGTSLSQLSPSENRILHQIQKVLEYPPSLDTFTNWTDFCTLPSTDTLTITCSGNHVTQLSIVGNRTRTSSSESSSSLSTGFSIDSFFTVLTKLSSLKVLSLVSVGLWGPLPPKISRFKSLEVLNLSSNYITGDIPGSVSRLQNLKSLVLADNLFNGSVPDLKPLRVLEELDLSRNDLGFQFPSVSNKVVSISLRNNSFRSLIPAELKGFDQLKKFDVSFNHFIGRIPPYLVSLQSIEYFNVAGNQLTGTFPADVSCGGKLEFVDLSHNLLSGKLPLCIESNSTSRVVLYSWNCLSDGNLKFQNPNSFCHEEALAVKPPLRVQEKASGKIGLVLGIIGGAIGAMAILGMLVFIIIRRKGREATEHNIYEKADVRKDSSLRLSPQLLTDARHVSPAMRVGALGLPEYHVFDFDEVEEATNNFDPANLMGEGSQGQLYKGRLREGSVVVVRCLRLMQGHSSQSLLRHMEVISKLRYPHLVSLLGHCVINHQEYSNGATTIFLIFEFVSNGTLRSHLTDWRKKEAMKWSQRVAVTVGVARGIQFLHTGVTPGIFGNNLKIENILLDENLTAKISTYFLPIPFVVGSESPFKGLESSERLDGAVDGEKDDVYRLGVILMEVITGKSSTSQDEVEAQRLQLEDALTTASSQLLLREVADPSLRGTYSFGSLKTTVEITVKCLSKDPSQRPSIEDVLWHLQYSVQVQEGWMTSGDLSMSQSHGLS
ncbi:hypothetical protein C5167_042458 [Papaver somniferum]|uniref:non-specific serine/threonine protein kinase n=1 Tax=Papaver somniferum TaxID=3469 RepID=A0A4Y7L678_PAPSO|nr:probable LRR receptor-like serine/threonine-protein kinase At1g14390 [Papaver somniferum]RZC79881.1 hypothetical protein C5167_042458 [Papaver somniferum]